MAQLPRGISPELLLSQVKNTMPYVFAPGAPKAPDTELGHFAPARVLRDFDAAVSAAEGEAALTHFEYFRLCVCAHYLSCATPVPTDVDNQIRLKLWPAKLPLETALEMSDLVLQARSWDFRLVSNRYSYGATGTAWSEQALDGHLGEWFTLSSAAYCALKQYKDAELAARKRGELLAAIADEVNRHSEIFGSLWRASDGLGALKASASVAHNFGDLDRVMDMWELDFGDPLRLGFYKLAIRPFDADGKLRYQGRLWVAGELYKEPIAGSAMALENHRHFALRKPRALRRSPRILIPIGPFFDEWGSRVARELKTPEGDPSQDTHEVIAALGYGWDRQNKSVGYGRALRGILEVHPELDFSKLTKVYTAQAVLGMPREQFERIWSDEAVRRMDDIPSRA